MVLEINQLQFDITILYTDHFLQIDLPTDYNNIIYYSKKLFY